jgi:glutamate 5-kinase
MLRAVKGTITLDNATGRALRLRTQAVHGAAVIDCAGEFAAGEPVFVSFRGRDGGQFVVARARSRQASGAIRAALKVPDRARATDGFRESLVVAAADVELIWPP